ncbi:MAG TPA: hypothetical protein VF600_13785 [Abditibacteriaceae bacterium]
MKSFVKIVYLCCVMMFSAVPSWSATEQDEDIKVRTDVAAVMDYMRTDKPRLASLWDTVNALPPGKVLAELRRYQHDSDERVRNAVLDFTYSVAKRNPRQSAAQQAIELIFEMATSDPSKDVASSAVSRLLKFSRAEIPPAVHRAVVEYLMNTLPNGVDVEIVELAGIAEVRNAQGKLRELASGNYRASHMARLALARMGDSEAIRYIVHKAQSEPDLQHNITLVLRDLSYIRHPEALTVLVGLLFNEGVQKGNGSDVPDYRFAQRATNYLADVVEGFPRFVTFTEARAWVTKRGIENLKIKR